MSASGGATVLAWGRLLRLPNVFTTHADVLVGLMATGVISESPATAGAILVSSSLLYLGGIALNDVVDLDEDRRERPQRPLPSGAISPGRAAAAAFGMLAGGVLTGLVAGYFAGSSAPPCLAIGLAGLILCYNFFGKRTAFGPLLLGLCRFANVLLGWSPAMLLSPAAGGLSALTTPLLTAAVTGSYVFVLSLLAKHETVGVSAAAAQRWAILPAIPLVWIGVLIARAGEDWFATQRWFGMALYLLLSLACMRVAVRVWRSATPQMIGRAVGGLLALIILVDATMLGVLGNGWAAAIVLGLYIPLLILRHWMYMT